MKLRTVAILLGASLLCHRTTAQNYAINSYKVAGGGGASTNGQFAVSGTIGQHDAGGALSGGSFAVTGGFWSGQTPVGPAAPASQTISFGPLANAAYGSAPFAISATASSGLPVTLSVIAGPATISGSTVTVTGIGEVTIEATQAGNGNFLVATPVDQSFATSIAPVASTILASDITTTSAILNSLVYPKNAAATVSFAWGTTVNLGTTNLVTTLPSELGGYYISNALSGLNPGTSYYYAVVASNADGLVVGDIFSFTTTIAPVVQTLFASNVTTTSATLDAIVYPKDAPTTLSFAWGTTPNLGHTNFVTTLPAEYGGYNITNVLTGLVPGTVYFYAAVATNTNGAATGSIFSFTTTIAPVVETLLASNVTTTSATLESLVYPKDAPTTVSFAWGTTTNLGNTNLVTTLPAEYGGYYISNTLSSLQPGQIYFYSVMATSTNGVATGNIMGFATIGGSVTLGRARILEAQLADGEFTIEFLGTADRTYILQATTNLADWTPVGTNSSPQNLRYFSDPAATNFGYRYYRIVPAAKLKESK